MMQPSREEKSLRGLHYLYEDPPRYQGHFHIVHDSYTRLRTKEIDRLAPLLEGALEKETAFRGEIGSSGDTDFRLKEKLDPKGGDGLWNTVAFRIRKSYFPSGRGWKADLHIFPYAWNKDKIEELLNRLGLSRTD